MESNFYDLAGKALKGELSASEATELEQLKADDDYYQVEFERLQSLWERSESLRSDITVGVDHMWTRFQQESEIASPNPWARMVRIAAVLVLVSGLLGIVYWMNSTPQLVAETGEGERQEILLSDGTTIWLNEGSSLNYPEEFSGDQRLVSLSGEAYFEVTSNPEHPFIIQLEGAQVAVLGTSFNVQAWKASPEWDVTVTEGRVSFSSSAGESVLLTANDLGTLSRAEGEVVKSINTDLNYQAWKTGKFIFSGTPIPEMVELLDGYYAEAITLKTGALEHCRITTSFEKAPLQEVLEELKLLMNATAVKEGDQVVIDGPDCEEDNSNK